VVLLTEIRQSCIEAGDYFGLIVRIQVIIWQRQLVGREAEGAAVHGVGVRVNAQAEWVRTPVQEANNDASIRRRHSDVCLPRPNASKSPDEVKEIIAMQIPIF